jgi:micrococcal nuclease
MTPAGPLVFLSVLVASAGASRADPEGPACLMEAVEAKAGARTEVRARATEAVAVVAAVAGDVVRLADGREVRLAGLDLPRRLGRAALDLDAPRLERARAALERLAGGHPYSLHATGATDRRGRVVGHLVDGGDWLNGRMVRDGHLRVAPSRGDRTCIAALLQLESEARGAARGVWSEQEFQPLGADDTELPSKGDSYALVEGEIRSTGRAGRRRYIDFGDDHRSDFTVVIMDADWARFAAAGIVFNRLKGRHVRVRGWLTANWGTEMILDAPEEIEWLDARE